MWNGTEQVLLRVTLHWVVLFTLLEPFLIAFHQESPDLNDKFCNYPNYVDLISCYSSFLSPKVVIGSADSKHATNMQKLASFICHQSGVF